MTNRIIASKYLELMDLYGPQGWWPLKGRYHHGEYDWPKTGNQIFEICAGAILTQNTAWSSVEIALSNLRSKKALTPRNLLQLDPDELKEAIRPSGYFNQKSLYLRTFAEFFLPLKGEPPSRETLLTVRGIGEETADSMLLYAWRSPWFVVDAYTRRIFSHNKVVEPKERYSSIQQKFHSALEPLYSGEERIRIYQEYHALIVQHAKLHFRG
jgi:endonuclease-3 related protein